MKKARKLKSHKKRRPAHVLVLALVMVMFWWGAWKVFDKIIFHDSIWSGVAAIVIAVAIFLIDDLKLKELE